ncbi:MAG: N-acetylmuramoyl-L-alanine amidase [Crenarchaeota archaeon]|nr:N-acetylmuramoyl-L-alanine amidase [Thermoproteota archaeon]
MYYPKRFYRQPFRPHKPLALVLHSCICACDFPIVKIDTPKMQQQIVRETNVMLYMEPDCVFHYIVELVGKDYEVFIQRPFLYTSPYFNIPGNNIYNSAIHIGIMGNYNVQKPVARMYDVLAYRLIAPLLYQYGLDQTKVFRHQDIDPKVAKTCPLSKIDMAYLKQRVQAYQVHQ